MLKAKLGEPSREELLWHGTGDTDSELITDSEEGFDMRFSYNGTHGIGNYFALEASYSADKRFIHVDEDGVEGIFLAQVLLGQCAGEVDENRKMPPLISEEGHARYDSVSDGHRMVVVYNNSKAYPSYYLYFKQEEPLDMVAAYYKQKLEELGI